MRRALAVVVSPFLLLGPVLGCVHRAPVAPPPMADVRPIGSPPLETPPSLPTEIPPPPDTDLEAMARPTAKAPGHWVFTSQYGWVFIPSGDDYTYASEDDDNASEFVFFVSTGWRWVDAPWVMGVGPTPFVGNVSATEYSWYHATPEHRRATERRETRGGYGGRSGGHGGTPRGGGHGGGGHSGGKHG